MKPIHWKKLLDTEDVRSYRQSFDPEWVVVSATVTAYNSANEDVTDEVIASSNVDEGEVEFQTTDTVEAGIYKIFITATMENDDIVDVPGMLTVTAQV